MKTGNTSIHNSLASAQADGSLGGVCYPRWRGDLHQARMSALYCADLLGEMLPSLRERYPSSDRRFKRMLQQYRAFVFRELRETNKAIISAETFGQLFSHRLASQLRDDLESLGFREFHIVLYVRDPADYYLSRTYQNLRMSDEPPFIKDPATFHYEWIQIADTWEQVFPGRLIVRKYPLDPERDVIEDFSSVLKERLGVSLARIPGRSNTSLSAEAMHILDDYRRTFWPDNGGVLTPDTARLVGFLKGSVHVIAQTKPTLKPAVAEQIRANHQADAKALHSRYGLDLVLPKAQHTAIAPRHEPYRVAEIVESVDLEVVHQLLLRLARTELGRSPAKRPLPLRVAAKAYRSIPPARRPARVDERLRKLFPG